MSASFVEASDAPKPARRRVPGPLLVALACCTAIGLVFVLPVRSKPTSPVTASRDIRFIPGADALVVVEDATTGQVIARIVPSNQGFARGFVHALDFIRMRHGIAPDRPFRLERLADGRLVLIDPSVPGTTVDVESFGSLNERAIASFLGRDPVS